MKKTVIYGLFAYAVLIGCKSGDDKTESANIPSVPVATVNPGNAMVYLEYPAKMEGQTDVELRAQVSGILEKIYITEGSYVKKGTRLFQIDHRPFTEDSNFAEGELLVAKADLMTAKLEVDKLTPLVQNKVVSPYQLKTAQTSYQASMARLKQAKAKAGNAKITLGFATVKAPVSGFVGRLFKKTGSIISPSDVQPLSYLSDNREIHAYFSISESDFVTFKEGLQGASIAEKIKNAPAVSIILSGGQVYPQAGKLDMVDAVFDKTTGAITLRATFPNEQGLLRSGNSGRIKLGLQQSNVIGIPQSATFEMQDKLFAFVVDRNNKVRQVALTISGTSDTTYYISEGLKAGDQLVLKGMESLKEGIVVKPEKSTEKIAKININ
ncbi:efflux RND transporter periplasmic adaptor subunit [Chryseobacterium sp. SIMBA_038]|uniref:efflux RND transporter periplasmic adaptor subunit n=1 Tax=Chryseobacterium sp. SIMBA_038 TaxID=3085780 RepID=UPI00397E7FB4